MLEVNQSVAEIDVSSHSSLIYIKIHGLPEKVNPFIAEFSQHLEKQGCAVTWLNSVKQLVISNYFHLNLCQDFKKYIEDELRKEGFLLF